MDAAADHYEAAIEFAPNDWWTHAAFAACCYHQGKPEAVDPLLARAEELAGDSARAWERIGWTWWVMDGLENARRSFARALALDPGRADARAWLGEVHLALGDTASAIRELERVTREHRGHSRARRALGEAYQTRARMLTFHRRPRPR
jgi:tetratricopeptide (TPR) repeat protein